MLNIDVVVAVVKKRLIKLGKDTFSDDEVEAAVKPYLSKPKLATAVDLAVEDLVTEEFTQETISSLLQNAFKCNWR